MPTHVLTPVLVLVLREELGGRHVSVRRPQQGWPARGPAISSAISASAREVAAGAGAGAGAGRVRIARSFPGTESPELTAAGASADEGRPSVPSAPQAKPSTGQWNWKTAQTRGGLAMARRGRGGVGVAARAAVGVREVGGGVQLQQRNGEGACRWMCVGVDVWVEPARRTVRVGEGCGRRCC